ncbi:MAG: hypothetical protein DWH91_19165 [Planctomycetota bacterium]|nr:MAG: hypothetical protein DWH91_19165 [Planctomycetota bacterium]
MLDSCQCVGHAQGRVTGTRVLPPLERQAVLEISFQGSGELLGIPITSLGSSQFVFRDDGVIASDEGHIIITGPTGDIVRLKASGLGRLTGPAPQGRYVTTGKYETTATSWQYLNEVMGLFEFIVDSTGGFSVKIWEWK